jgi:tRNA1(Val) A37 N6-methylase TrmN6
LEKLGLSADRSVHHASSGGPDLARVLSIVGVPRGSRIVDLGSGKGGATLTLGEFPFTEIVGVEVSREMVDIAKANTTRAGRPDIRFVHRDAAEFVDLDRFTHVYMYHPFHEAVVDAVIANVAASLARAPRWLTLIYKNPVWHDAILASGLFRVTRELKFGRASHDDDLFRVYVHEGSR